jgi:2-hydroxychromene-2-carboxylate isomerase
MPAGHPFNSLPLLRLAWLLGPSPAVVARLFRYVWAEGHLPQQAGPWHDLLGELGVADEAALAAAREPLRAATDAAVARGVFGVPTAAVGGELFWGYDATDLLLAYCRDPAVLDSEAMRAADAVPVAAARRTAPAGA